MLALLVVLSACSEKSARQASYQPRPVSVEIVTLQQQQLEELARIDTQFVVPLEEALVAEQRINLFFSRFCGARAAEHSIQRKGRSTLRREHCPDYDFTLRRSLTPGGYSYTVLCSPRTNESGDSLTAVLRSRILAKFIQSGEIELELLEPGRAN